MPDFSRWGANGGDPSLNAIGRTDRYLDALASEQPVYATDPADAELATAWTVTAPADARAGQYLITLTSRYTWGRRRGSSTGDRVPPA